MRHISDITKMVEYFLFYILRSANVHSNSVLWDYKVKWQYLIIGDLCVQLIQSDCKVLVFSIGIFDILNALNNILISMKSSWYIYQVFKNVYNESMTL